MLAFLPGRTSRRSVKRVRAGLDRALGDLIRSSTSGLSPESQIDVPVEAHLGAAEDEVGRALPAQRGPELRGVEPLLDQLGARARAVELVAQPIVVGAQLGQIDGAGRPPARPAAPPRRTLPFAPRRGRDRGGAAPGARRKRSAAEPRAEQDRRIVIPSTGR